MSFVCFFFFFKSSNSFLSFFKFWTGGAPELPNLTKVIVERGPIVPEMKVKSLLQKVKNKNDTSMTYLVAFVKKLLRWLDRTEVNEVYSFGTC